ncbi:hypothetical protein ACR3H8_19850 [Pseudomonas aeruginosa]|uniref:hypothetical protein n=1 Tax=Pseudomonas aeruginosa group TaxID=136841 RepID=UPI0003BAF1F5|nr:hypothetical protein [Pseudomonas aeruginosa]ELD5772766.1 hypothetical protein [Pseudomonas aeruginosa]ERW61401.1 hypothetical protein Q024_06448 [Pseudomonas aeruginosa BWHPSA011]ETV28873.1 hypothetical protein Q046_05790 [Pseudomonas aeruginosa BWHPSA041]MBA5210102.1 hypothetical protein [Pseudomonas aeruginosa]MBG3917505.1 hypothetical protein [Pseudomonas aeruginosa]
MKKCILGVIVAIIDAASADTCSAAPVVINSKMYISDVENPMRIETGADIECRKLGQMVTVHPGGSVIIQGGNVVRGEDGSKRCRDAGDEQDEDSEGSKQGGVPDLQEEKSSLPSYQTGPSQIWN